MKELLGDIDSFIKNQNIIGIHSVDTRSLTRKIREYGVMNGMITTENVHEKKDELMKLVKAFSIKDAVRNVSIKEKKEYKAENSKYKVVLIDLGYKRNIRQELLKRGCDVIVVPDRTTAEEIKALAEKAKTIIADRVEYYAPKIGVTYNRVTIRCQRTRWGSCSSKGNLNFNCLLALFPVEIIDSVVVHELCHRKHMNHSPQFYAEIEKVFPEYKKWHNWLNDNGGVYMARVN